MSYPRQQQPGNSYGRHPSTASTQRSPSAQQRAQFAGRNSAPMSPRTQRRRDIADKLIHDCYSKVIDDNGHMVKETSYQIHLTVQELSSFPSHPPPEGTPITQVGNIKDRFLAICSKYSGRVQLHKGKLNEQKRVYQIGRVWDIDELKAITKVGEDGIILSLNKDYYWKSGEEYERLWRFARALANVYGSYMGKYPVLNGFTLEDFNLPPVPMKKLFSNSNRNPSQEIAVNEPKPNAQLLKSRSLKRKNLPNPVLPVQPPSISNSQASLPTSDHYKDFDFTSNGKLPMKPMMVMERSPVSSSTSVFVDTTVSSKANDLLETESPITPQAATKHPYQNLRDSDAAINDSHSFVFQDLDDPQPKDITSERKTSHRNTSETMDAMARLSMQLEEHISLSQREHGADNNSDFGIEEIMDESEDEVKHTPKKPLLNEDAGVIEESTGIEGNGFNNTIDSSIQEIEDFMDSQLNFKGSIKRRSLESNGLKEGVSKKEVILIESAEEEHEPADNHSFSITEDGTIATNDSEADMSISKKDKFSILDDAEKDLEIEELLDELQWSPTDDADTTIKVLTKELNRLKFNNVKQIINLDFSGDTMKDDLTNALNEVEHLTHIFKRMEMDFKNFAPEISYIENNSQGLQVKSVNKKLLYNDLRTMLDKVSVSSKDLQSLQSFSEFDRLSKLEKLEAQLLSLYNALRTIKEGNDQEDIHLNSMEALKQYEAKYQQVAFNLTENFISYFKQQFDHKMSELVNGLERIYPKSVFIELNGLIIYSPLTLFIKDIFPQEFGEFVLYITQALSELLEKLLKVRLKTIKYSSSSTQNNTALSKSESTTSLRKSRTLRLNGRSDRFKGKFSLTDDSRSEHSEKDENGASDQSKYNNTSTGVQANKGIEDVRSVVEVVNDTKDLAAIIQHFIAAMFHFDTNIYDLNEYLEQSPFKKRRQDIDKTGLDKSDFSSYSNELVASLNNIFGTYNALFVKRVVPVEYNLPLILSYLETLSNDSQRTNQDYFVFNFLKKVVGKYEGLWKKFVDNQIDFVKKANISAKSGVVPAVKSVNQFFLGTESVLDKPSRLYGDLEETSIKHLIDDSYRNVTNACIELFLRDDPLLKSNEFDDKERNYRNVSIIQNIFSVTEQLSAFNNPRTRKVKQQLDAVCKKCQDAYFQRLIHKNIGKLVEFVTNFEALGDTESRTKKYNKKFVKTLLSSYTSKDISLRVQEIHRKLEKHFITGSSMFENDMVDKLWLDMEKNFVDYFTRLDKILRGNYSDIDYHMGKAEIHSIFNSVH